MTTHTRAQLTIKGDKGNAMQTEIDSTEGKKIIKSPVATVNPLGLCKRPVICAGNKLISLTGEERGEKRCPHLFFPIHVGAERDKER